MKTLLSFFALVFALSANAQTFTVQNLQVNGTTNLIGAVTGPTSLSGPTTFSGTTGFSGTTNFTGPITSSSTASFTGATTATTQGFLDNSTLVATDAFTKQEILAATAEIPIANFTGGTYNFQTAGTGASLVVFVTGGVVASIPAIANPGSGYQVGDCLILVGGNGDAIARVTSVSGGGVSAASVLYGGTGYTTGATLIASPLPPGSRTANLNGVLTSNALIIIPAGTYLQGARRVSFSNNTTGAFTVQVKLSNGAGGSTGNGVFLPQGTANSTSALLYTDGVNDVWAETAYAPSFQVGTASSTGAFTLGNATTPISLNGSVGTGGQVLESAGAGATPTWNTITGTGTVTSVNASGGTTGLTFSGGPITGSGTLTEAGTLVIANGGTGQTTKAAAFNALSPMTTTGDLEYEVSTGTAARLPIGSTNQVLTVVAGAPAWEASAGGSSVVNGFINGFGLSNDGTSPNTVLDEAAGYAANSANTVMITGTAFTKSTAGPWAAGTGNNGMGTGLTIAASTWYHVFAIISSGSYDVYYDTSPTAANAPASTTSTRYIGSFKTDASAHILAFTQTGQTFIWTAVFTDLSGGTATTETPITISTPLGFVTTALEMPNITPTAAGDIIRLFAGTSTAVASMTSGTAPAVSTWGYAQIPTNTSSQISYFVTSAADSGLVRTTGYINPHVAPNF